MVKKLILGLIVAGSVIGIGAESVKLGSGNMEFNDILIITPHVYEEGEWHETLGISQEIFGEIGYTTYDQDQVDDIFVDTYEEHGYSVEEHDGYYNI